MSKRKAAPDHDEGDFPRGIPREPKAGSVLAGAETAGPARERKAEKRLKEDEDDEPKPVAAQLIPKRAPKLIPANLETGSLLVCAIREVSDEELVVNLPYQLSGYIIRNHVAEETVLADLPPITEVYVPGQLVVAVVTAVVLLGRSGRKMRIELSLRPSLVNAGLTAEGLLPHMFLPAAVHSKEEHVFRLSFGIEGVTGLLKVEETALLPKPPCPGSIVYVSIQSINERTKTARCVMKSVGALGGQPALNTTTVRAGFLVDARILNVLEASKEKRPLEEENGGIIVNFCGRLMGTVHWHYQSGIGQPIKLAKKQHVTARVIAVIPGENTIIHLSLLPNLLDWTQNTTLLMSFKMGQRCTSEILDVTEKDGCRMRCNAAGVKTTTHPSILGFCKGSRMSLKGDGQCDFARKAPCRVIGRNFLDNLVLVTRRAEDLSEDVMVSVEELQPGQMIKGEIDRIVQFGVVVKLSEFISGVVPLRQLTDVPLAEVPKRFKVGTLLKCRVLRTWPESNKVSLTTKKSFVKATHQLTKFQQAKTNMLATGYVSGVKDYGVIVNFYGDVYGLIPNKDITDNEIEAPAVGMAVRCRIDSVNGKAQRMALSLNLEGGKEPEDCTEDLVSGVPLGEVVAQVMATESVEEGIYVNFSSSGGMSRGFVPRGHLSDDLQQAAARQVAIGASLGGEPCDLGEAVVLASSFTLAPKDGEESQHKTKPVALLSLKPSVRLAAEAGAFITDIKDLQERRMYSGWVKSIGDFGVLVSVGSWKASGVCPKHLLADTFKANPGEHFKPGQTLRVMVVGKDVENNRWTADLRPYTPSPQDVNLLEREAEAVRQFFNIEASLAPPSSTSPLWTSLMPGSVLDAVVGDTKSFGTVLQTVSGVTALALKENMPAEMTLVKGNTVKCAVLDVNTASNIIDVSLQPALVAAAPAGAGKTSKGKRKRGQSDEGKPIFTVGEDVMVLPALQKASYSILWSKDPPRIFTSPPWERKMWDVPRLATVHSLPAERSIFVRDVVQCPRGSPQGAGRDKVPKIVKPDEELHVGGAVKMRIHSVKGLQALLAAPVNVRGHLHATQMVDVDAVDGHIPMGRLRVRDTLEARILSIHPHGQGPEGKIFHLELTSRPSLMTAQDASVYEKAVVSWQTLKKGQWLPAAIMEVKRQFLWVEVAPGIKGRVASLDASPDLARVVKLEDHFEVGSVVEAQVLSTIRSQQKLDLVFRGVRLEEVGRTLARLDHIGEVQGKGFAATFTVPGKRTACVHITEIFDFWVQFPLKRLRIGKIYEAVVLRNNVEEMHDNAEITLRASQVHGQSEAMEEARVSKVGELKVGQKVSGYVVNSNDKGVFVAISRFVTGRIRLRALSDSPVDKDKVALLHPLGELVRDAVVTEIDEDRKQIELSLRTNDAGRITLEQLSVGDVVSGRVKGKQTYGMFIRLENSTLDGLVHTSEISENNSVTIDSFKLGDQIKRAKVTKLENGKVSLSIKPSHFEVDQEESDGSEIEVPVPAPKAAKQRKTKEAAAEDKAKANTGIATLDDSDEEAPWNAAVKDEVVELPSFDFPGFAAEADEDMERGAEGSQSDNKKLSRGKRKAAKIAEKEELQRLEAERAQPGTIEPTSIDDFEKLLLTQGSMSIIWIRYMAHHLKVSDLARAREVAERGVKHVGFSESKERFNVWVAFMNLECTFGTEETTEAVVRRAASFNNAKQVYLHLARIHERNKNTVLAVKVYETAAAKYKESKKVWIGFFSYLYRVNDLDGGRKILPKCLAALPRRKHPVVVSKAGMLEYQYGSAERGRSIFEGLLDNYPKRTDLWNIYIDYHTKAHLPPLAKEVDLKSIRALLERCCAMKLKAMKMRFFFKKWLDFEKKWGNAESEEVVRTKAREFVDSQAN
mmetsp:Transcript_19809/g.53028  ORF Transcript_19809/g.53028 Transcript_19809/m.53028 type:complete len:1878 (-) Transcript_19809:167-5800(-)